MFARASAAVLIVGAGVALAGGPAGAKVLPVTSVDVTTPKPTVGRPVDVVVRMRPPFDLGDFAWEKFEVSIVPSNETDAHGWPYRTTFHGAAVRLHRIAKGTYRGTVVFHHAGDYVVVDWSHVYAGDAYRAEVENKSDYLAPVPLHVAAVAPAITVGATHTDGSSRTTIVWSGVAVFVAFIVLCGVRVRSWRRVLAGETFARQSSLRSSASTTRSQRSAQSSQR